MSRIYLENVSFSYNKECDVIHEISTSFSEGRLYIVVGPNGSGKTTLLNCMAANFAQYTGGVYINDKEIRKITNKERAKLISYVPQSTIVDFDYSVFEIVLMGRSPYISLLQNESQNDIEIAERSMQLTGVLHLKDKNIKEISGGERQRVLIARALAQQAAIMLLDEPASMLDVHHEISVMETLKAIAHEQNAAVIAVMHDLNLASRYADCILLMSNGSIVSSGTANEVLTTENLEKVYSIYSKFIELDGERIIVAKHLV